MSIAAAAPFVLPELGPPGWIALGVIGLIGLGVAGAKVYNQSSSSSGAAETDKANEKAQELPAADTKGTCPECDDKKDKKPKKRKVSDSELNDKNYNEAEKYLDKELRDDAGWNKDALKDGNGVRYYDGKGNSVQLNKGYPEGLQGGGGDATHAGPYAKISQGGSISRIILGK